jgi:hypothetical protein
VGVEVVLVCDTTEAAEAAASDHTDGGETDVGTAIGENSI